MSEPLQTIIEVREEFMISPVGYSNPIQRTAHFLKPSVNHIDGAASAVPSSSLSSLPPVFEPSKGPLTIQFRGWRSPPKKWIDWVDSLRSTYESVWKKVGIYESIMGTKCDILKNKELVLGVAERWCIKTNTFVFPWAEATITLEDIMILGGYPVIGACVFSPLETQELKEIEEKLLLARREAKRTKQHKSSTSAWMHLFVNSGKDIEHEAFLAAWLSMFVFPETCLVRKIVFPIAIRLARGNPIALAPAVLASIYRDLTLLKQTIVDLTKSPVNADAEHLQLILRLRSPFYLVQMWVWERFESLQPIPRHGQPQFARWHKVKALKIDNVRFVLDSSGEKFLWRPYGKLGGMQKKFYKDNELWVPPDLTLDKELLSFFLCLRASELVGLDCVKQYLPHRVAMQFGMDQDIPGCVARFNDTLDIAWDNYDRPISDKSLYAPSRLFEADITARYAGWWKQSVLGHGDPVKNIVRRKRSLRSSKHRSQASKAKKSDNAADVPPGFAPKRSIVLSGNFCQDGTSKTKKGDNDADLASGFLPKLLKTLTVSKNALEEGSKAKKSDNAADVPPGFAPKRSTVLSGNCCEDGTSKTKKGDNDAGVPSGFLPKRLKTLTISENSPEEVPKAKGDNNADVPPGFSPKHNTVDAGNFVKECNAECLEDINCGGMSYSPECGNFTTMDSLMKPVVKINDETAMEGLEEAMQDANQSNETGLAYERVNQLCTGGEGRGYASGIIITELEERISRLERVVAVLKKERLGHSNRS